MSAKENIGYKVNSAHVFTFFLFYAKKSLEPKIFKKTSSIEAFTNELSSQDQLNFKTNDRILLRNSGIFIL